MQIQHAPVSSNKNTVVVAWRDGGGFWAAARVDVGEPWSVSDLLHASVTAESHGEHYYSHAGENVTLAEAREIVRGK